MKKYLLFAAATLLTSVGAVATAPVYTEDFATQEKFDAWKVLDLNQDGSTWEYDATGTDYKVFYRYNSANNGDDWLISPKINLNAGQYLCKFDTKGSSYGETLEVWTGTDVDASAMTAKHYDQTIPYEDVNKSFLFTVDEAGEVVLGFHATSPADAYRLYLANITIEECPNPMDIALTAVKSPLSGENLAMEDVTVTVKNEGPTEISSFTLSYQLTKGEETTEVSETVTPLAPLAPGAQMDYTFAAKADMSTPRQAYALAVTASIEGDINSDNNSIKVELRHLAAATVPYTMGFEPEEDTSSIAILNCNNDSGDWSINIDSFFSSFSRTGMGSMCYNYDSTNAADDWFFLDPFALEEGTYCLKFWYSATANHPERLRVYYGSAPTPEAMTNVLCEYNPVTNEHYEESISFFEIPEAGKYYVGFYAFSDANENWLCIDDVSLDKIDPTVGDLQLMSIREPFEYRRAPHADVVKADVRNIGMVDVTADLIVAIDGNEAKRETVTIPAMKNQTVTLENALGQLAEGEHAISVSFDYPQDSDLSNNEIERSLVVLPESANDLWDFENVSVDPTDDRIFSVPSDLTYRKEDYNNLHSDSGAEFDPEHGFGIFSLQHYALGAKALACCTWFESSGSADRWVVLPQMEVTGSDAWFAFDALSFNPGFLESYRVKVSDGDDHWSDYDTILTVNDESTDYKTRGISLAEYVGKKIYIAVNIVTYGGEALVLDNMGVYGSVRSVGSGVNQTLINDNNLSLKGNYLVANDGVESIEIFNANGVKVADSNDTSIYVGTLPAGVYVARAVSNNKTYTLKFTR